MDDVIAAEYIEDFVLTITGVSPGGVVTGIEETVVLIRDDDDGREQVQTMITT